jgi:ribonuclease HII
MTTICGIDEAGRGPVIGPLVIAGATIAQENAEILERIGVKDSKLLTPEQRKRMYYQLINALQAYEILIVPPFVIDDAVLSTTGMNLNWLEATKSAEILNKLNPNITYVDCPSNNITAYASYLRQKLVNKKVQLVCEHKADATYAICSAASILAKVTRDTEIEKIRHETGIDFGSGYPSDPKTVAFLRDYWDKFDVFRKSWESWQRFARNNTHQKKLGEW